MIKVNYVEKRFFFESHNDFQKFHAKNYGKKNGNKYELNIYEVLYLINKNKIEVYKKDVLLVFDDILKQEKNIYSNYIVYKDLRDRGYKIGSGLKYGFIFRVYTPNREKDHSLWLVEPIDEKDKIKIKDFVGKNRVAHSTKKKMMFAVVDSDYCVTYLEVNWMRV